MRNYEFNITNWVSYLIPKQLRNERLMAFVNALIAPLQQLNTAANDWANSVFYDVQFNGQVVMLEHLLNDTFDDTSRRITITDGEPTATPTLRNKIEARPTMIIRRWNEDGTPNILRPASFDRPNFVVNRNGANIDPTKATAIINRYKIAAKTFTIN